MRILAFTDSHFKKGSWKLALKKAKDADIIIGGGDFSDWGQETEKVISKFKDIDKPFLVIHGNHETEEQMLEIEKKFKNVLFLHKRSYQVGNYVFFGYGGGGFSQKDKDFERVSEKFAKTIKKEDTIIILTHGPPYGTKLDTIDGLGHTGSKSLRKFLENKKPVLWICGHIHETSGDMEVIGNTVITNPGPDGKIIEI